MAIACMVMCRISCVRRCFRNFGKVVKYIHCHSTIELALLRGSTPNAGEEDLAWFSWSGLYSKHVTLLGGFSSSNPSFSRSSDTTTATRNMHITINK